MRIQVAREAEGVPPDRAIAWWTDFREGPTDHAWIPGQRRRILRREGREVEMQDDWYGLFTERVTAWVEDHAVRFRGRNTFGEFGGAYVFVPHAAGTRVALDVDLTLRRGLRWTGPVARPIARWVILHDLKRHLREMREEHLDG